MSSRAGRIRMLMATTLVALSCESPLAPRPQPGIYVLESMGEQPLPTLVLENFAVRTYLTADTLLLTEENAGRRVRRLRSESVDEDVVSFARVEWPIHFERRDREVRAREEAACLPGDILETCTSLRDQGVRVVGETVRIGIRWYRRVTPPTGT